MKDSITVMHSDGSSEEFKASIIKKTIMKETDVDEELAEKIKNNIVKKIYKLQKNDDLQTISTSTIRAEVSHYLLHHAEFDAEVKNRKLGMSVNEFETLLQHGCKDNANIFFSPELIAKYSYDSIAKEYALLNMPKECSKAHTDGYIAIHDLEYYNTRPNCANWSIPFIARNGIKVEGKGRYGSVAGPAKSLEVLLNQMLEFLMSAALVLSGGQSFSAWNCYLAPYARGRTYKEIKQAIQNFIFNANCALIVRGGQTCFSSVNTEFSCPDFLKGVPAVGPQGIEIGTYDDYEEEIKLIFRAIVEVIKEKDYNERFHTFPNQVFMIREHTLDEYTEEVKMVHELLAENPTIYFSNVAKEESVTMGCLGKDELITYKNLNNEIISEPIGVFVEDKLQQNQSQYYDTTYTHLNNKYQILSLNNDNNSFEWKNIKTVMRNPNTDMCEVKLSKGLSLICTKNHPVLTSSGHHKIYNKENGKPISDLTKNHRLIRYNQQVLPIQNNPIGILIGFFLGDGYIYNKQNIGITLYKKEKQEFLEKILNQTSLIYSIASFDKGDFQEKRYSILKSQNIENINFIDDLINMKHGSILHKYLNEKYLDGILTGLINADGYLHLQDTDFKDNHLTLQISNTNQEIIKFCMIAGGLFGLSFAKYIKQQPQKETHNLCYDIKVAGANMFNFLQNIPLHDIHKKTLEKANTKCKTQYDFKTILPMEIKDIKYDGYVYDLEVEDNHNYVTGESQIVSHNCRTRLPVGYHNNYEDDCLNVGNFHYTTLNLALIAHEAQNKDDLFDKIKHYMDISRKALLDRKKNVEDILYNKHMSDFLLQKDIKTGKQLYDIERCSFSIGLCGLNEALLEFYGEDITCIPDKGEEIIKYMTSVLNEYKEIDGLRWSLFFSPAESQSHRFAEINKTKYSDSYVQGTPGSYYLTNSSHIAVDSDKDIIEHIKNGNIFHKYAVAGNILHIWLGEPNPDPVALWKLNQKIIKTEVKFWDFTNDYTFCHNCGFTIQLPKNECPKCGSDDVTIMSRVTGYYQPVNGFNDGKKQEFIDRYRHKLN